MIFGIVWIALYKTPLTEFHQIFIAVRLPFREGKFGKMIVAELEIEVAARSDLCRIIRRFRLIRKQSSHLFFAFQIELIVGKPHAVRIIQRLSCLNAEKNIVIAGIFLSHVMSIVRHRQRDSGLLRDPDQTGGRFLLFADSVILDLQIEVIRAEQFL